MKRRRAEVDAQIDAFVRDIALLIRQHVEETVREALGSRALARATPKRRARKAPPAAKPERGDGKSSSRRKSSKTRAPSKDTSAAGLTGDAPKKLRPEQLTLF
jgi:hypothetical protein